MVIDDNCIVFVVGEFVEVVMIDMVYMFGIECIVEVVCMKGIVDEEIVVNV